MRGASAWNAWVTSGARAMICSISFWSCSEVISSWVARCAVSCCEIRRRMPRRLRVISAASSSRLIHAMTPVANAARPRVTPPEASHAIS